VTRPVYVAGTRTFAAEVADFAEEAGFRVVGLLETIDRERVGTTIHDLPVTWLEDTEPAAAIIGTGERSRRAVVARLVAAGWELPPLVHPRAHVARTSVVGAGAVVAPGAVVGARSRVGEHALLGRGVLVGHHTEVGAYATLNPGANVAGNVRIGPDAFVGMAAIVRDHLTVGASAVVAAGALVLRDVPDEVEVRGFPAAVHARAEPDAEPVGEGARGERRGAGERA
jgi:sugar O-acyltransferase (sialic acid O-acetyltransferase NeuD family)